MAGRGDDWNSFMRSRQARMVLNGLCTFICATYAFDAVRELVTGGSELLIEQLGTTAYYAITVLRCAVCAWVAVTFGRMVVKDFAARDDE